MADIEKVKKGLTACAKDKCEECSYKSNTELCIEGMCKNALSVIEELQEEIERLHPKNGKWYQQLSKCPSAINNGGSRTQKCSLCGGWGKKTFAFCPHCGAKMEIVR